MHSLHASDQQLHTKLHWTETYSIDRVGHVVHGSKEPRLQDLSTHIFVDRYGAPGSIYLLLTGRGYRRGRSYAYDDDPDDSDADYPGTDIVPEPTAAAPASSPKITVDAIFGWRWPLSEAEKAEEACALI